MTPAGSIARAPVRAVARTCVSLPPQHEANTMTAQPEWRLRLATDSFAIFEDLTGVYAPEIEMFFEAPDDDESDAPGEVYRFPIERCRVVGEIVTTDPAGNVYHFGKERSFPEWFSDDLAKVADSVGSTAADLREALACDDTLTRAEAYLAIAGYHGVANFDQYPRQVTRDDWSSRVHGTERAA